ncbi:MAG TPA: hypothetical protein VFV67_16385 [Actinophytocola sp.]|uniref:helix-turn-helix domain-containing protein n=1 Tax=Actinophytocola sp. TaxID=1872138 RepID=UPI002DBF3B02|nr:hypothetical protein [Actinophytocola sp.]HEU5472233.1 hypothetical protein [Actinophytocola sp.]
MTTVQRWTGAEIKALRSAMRRTVRAFAEHLGVDSRTVNKWESRGSGITPRPETQGILDSALRLAGPEVQSRFAQAVDRGRQVSRVATPVRDRFSPGDVEQLRRALHDLFAGGQVTAASLDDWEQTVARQGTATKDRPATILVRDLAADVAELGRVMAGCHSLSAQRRLTRVAANLSGLMCLTQVKLDDRQAFRRWARTARIAANEADDASTYSWVLPSVGQTKRAPPCGEPRLWCPGWAWKGRNHRRSPTTKLNYASTRAVL